MKLINWIKENETLGITTYFMKDGKFYRTTRIYISAISEDNIPVYLMGEKSKVVYSSIDSKRYYFNKNTCIIPIHVSYKFESSDIKMIERVDTHKVIWYDGADITQ